MFTPLKSQFAFPSRSGFTLSELLIAVSILGVIAAFAISSILRRVEESHYSASAKEVISMISESVEIVRSRYGIHSYTRAGPGWSSIQEGDFFRYWNYVRRNNNLQFDSPGGSILSCGDSNLYDCYVLHNGGLLITLNREIGGTATNRFFPFFFDPDGVVTGQANHTLTIAVYANGRVTSGAHLLPNSRWYNQTWQPRPDPDWFSW